MGNIVEVKYKIKKEYCRCCGREFDESEEHESSTAQINISELIDHAKAPDDTEYAEDLTIYVGEYLFKELNCYMNSGNTAYIEDTEIDRVLKLAVNALKEENVTIINEPYLTKYLAEREQGK